MPVSELPGLLALAALATIAFGCFCFAAAGLTLLIRTLRRSRPAAVDWDDLDSACCLRWWETRGADHDRSYCSQGDTTR